MESKEVVSEKVLKSIQGSVVFEKIRKLAFEVLDAEVIEGVCYIIPVMGSIVKIGEKRTFPSSYNKEKSVRFRATDCQFLYQAPPEVLQRFNDCVGI